MCGTPQDGSGQMSRQKSQGSKSETLSLRLDPKAKFILEFVARINGQTLTTVVERAIRASCDQVAIGKDSQKQNWQSFWDPDEGVRMLKLLACEHYPSSYDEDDLKRFTEEHWEFFYHSSSYGEPHRAFIQILWPKIEEYRRIWRERRETDYWAAGRAMQADLFSADVEAPKWPRIQESVAGEVITATPF
jgi:hypothetical protein